MLTTLEQGVRGGRWHTLIDKVYAPLNLLAASASVIGNQGAAGVDHQTVEAFEAHRLQELDRLHESLRTDSYRPQAVRRVWIPKPGSKEQRPLGVPAMLAMRDMMTQLKLTVNESKTHVCHVPDESFDFLGYTFGRMYAPRTGPPYIGACPSKKKVGRLRQAISEQTSARWGLAEPEEIVEHLNRMLRGWANYFSYGSVNRAYRAVDYHTRERLRQWLCRKHKVDGRGTARFPLQYGYQQLGLIELRAQRRRLPRAKA